MTDLSGFEDIKNRHRLNGAEPARSFRLIDFDTITDAVEVDDFVEGLLCRDQESVLVAEPHCGKTFLAMDLAAHVALGRRWFGREVDRCPVVYIAAEGGRANLNRLVAFRRHHDIKGKVPLAILPETVDLCSRDCDLAALVSMLAGKTEDWGERVGFIIIDTLSRAMAGGNENAPDDMGRYVANVGNLRKMTGAHVMSLHHPPKGGEGSRGSGVLFGAIDTEIRLQTDAATNFVTARVTKQRHLPEGTGFSFTLQSVDIGTNRRGKPVSSCVIQPLGDAPAANRNGVNSLCGNTKVVFDMLARAICDSGEVPSANNHIPAGFMAVKVEIWRRYAIQGLIAETGESKMTTQDAKSKAFRRAVKSLQDAALVATWSDWVWIVKR